MKCQSCGKKEATVKYIEDINGKKQEIHFCIDCAKKLGFVDFSSMFSPIFTNIPNLFDDFVIEEEQKCPVCGYTFEDYANTGMFGCPKCYDTFSDRLDEIFLKLHGKNRHVKSSKKNIKLSNRVETKTKFSKEDEILGLRKELESLVKNEEYEKAAVIRDKIKGLESKK